MAPVVFCWSLMVLTAADVAISEPIEQPRELRQQLLIMNLKGGEGMSDAAMQLINDVVQSEFQRTNRYRVTSEADVATMLTVEQKRQLVGCETDTECLVEIGGALGARFIATGSVGQLGTNFVLTLKVANADEARVAASWSRDVSEDELISAARVAVADLLAQLSGELPPGAMSTTNFENQSSSSPVYKKWWFWTLAVAVVGGAATGAVLATSAGGGDGNQTPDPDPADATLTIQLP